MVQPLSVYPTLQCGQCPRGPRHASGKYKHSKCSELGTPRRQAVGERRSRTIETDPAREILSYQRAPSGLMACEMLGGEFMLARSASGIHSCFCRSRQAKSLCTDMNRLEPA